MSRKTREKRRFQPHSCMAPESLETRQLMAGDFLQAVQAVELPSDRLTQIVSRDSDPTRGIGGIDEKLDLGGGREGGQLREVAVAHIGQSGSADYHVSAVGTGAEIQLAAWRSGEAMSHLNNGSELVGHDIELSDLSFSTPRAETSHETPSRGDQLTLGSEARLGVDDFAFHAPDQEPLPAADSLAGNVLVGSFLASWVGGDGNLWLSTKSINHQGSFFQHDTHGFGSNIDVTVIDHAVTQRQIGDALQVVTPVIVEADGQRQLRVVTWEISGNSVDISGQSFSEPLDVSQLPQDGGSMTIHHAENGVYEIGFKNQYGRMATQYVLITPNGSIFDGGGGASGKSYTGGSTSHTVGDFATVRLNDQAFVAIDHTADDVNATVWERRTNDCFLVLCNYEPYQLGDSADDMRSSLPGVTVPLPELTHAYGTSPGTGEQFGTSVVTGDFNGDGHVDLAVGAPGENVDGNNNAGAVTILYGSESGLYTSPFNRTITQDTPGVKGVANENDRFGFSLAAGDFNGDGNDDLAIGAPGESIEADGLSEVGIVHILYGSSSGVTTSNDVILRQGVDGVAGISEAGDQFGFSLATGDFNNDGKKDLVVGIPFEDHNQAGITDGGAVHAFYGHANGLSTANDETLHLNQPGMLGATAAHDQYGYSLATGDITGDGRDELVVGIPGKSAFGMADTGAVHIIRGTASGIGTHDQLISQDGIQANDLSSMGDISDSTETGDRFGEAVALGDFNGDGLFDLAVSAPEEDHHGLNAAGKVHVLTGTAQGIDSINEKLFDQETSGVPTTAQIGSRFGFSLATGEVNGDGYHELLVGIPHQDRSAGGNVTYANVGAAVLLRGGASGTTTFYADTVEQESYGIDGDMDPSDHFARAIALADFNGDGYGDAVLGVPNENVQKLSTEYSNAGQVHVVYGENSGLSDQDQVWVQGTTKHIRAKLADAGWEEQYGVGGGELYEAMPDGEAVPEHAASVTKTMTLLLAVEALDLPNSPIALDDVVTISEKAGTTGGSKMKGTLDGEEALLEPGDEITLEALLYGMMIHSGNRASVAIAEHVALNVYGADPYDLDDPFNVFVDHMNERAEDMSPALEDTRYGHPAGGSTTMPQDLITFWRQAWKNPRFRTYAGAKAAYPNNPATTVNTDSPKEFTLERNSSYVGHDGYKGGHGRVGSVYDEQGVLIETEICDQCHVGSATRGGHQLVVGIQQSGEDTTNAKRLYDFGFQQLFTPDRRGTSEAESGSLDVIAPGIPTMGDLQALDLDHVDLGKVVAATVDNQQQLQLQLWHVNPNNGNIVPSQSRIEAYEHLAMGPAGARDEVVDVVQLPSGGRVLGDYVSGVIQDGDLRLDAWRIGAEYVEPIQFVPGVIVDLTPDDDGPNIDDFETPQRPTPQPRPGDANGDGSVDFADFLITSANFGKEADAVFADGDFNGDMQVNFADFLILSAEFGAKR